MIACMANKRNRLIIDVPEEVRLAIRMASTRADKTVSKFLEDHFRKHFATEIQDASKYVPKKRREPE